MGGERGAGAGAGGVSVVVLPFWPGGVVGRGAMERLAEFFTVVGGEWEAIESKGAPIEEARGAKHESIVFFSPESGIPPKEILKVVALLSRCEVATGSRFAKESIRQGKCGWYVAQEWFVAWKLRAGGAGVSDAASGLVAARKRALGGATAASVAELPRAIARTGGKACEAPIMWIARRPESYQCARRPAWGAAQS